MRAGDIAAFPKGVPDGHHLVNRSGADCAFVAIGRPAASDCHIRTSTAFGRRQQRFTRKRTNSRLRLGRS
jgi:uncharacterized cupin superfamily protein